VFRLFPKFPDEAFVSGSLSADGEPSETTPVLGVLSAGASFLAK
jgi:hypothetical protein